MSKLVASNGQIDSISTFKEGPVTMNIRRRAICPNGDLGQVEIEQSGSFVTVTFKQALSLANEIIRRCSQ